MESAHSDLALVRSAPLAPASSWHRSPSLVPSKRHKHGRGCSPVSCKGKVIGEQELARGALSFPEHGQAADSLDKLASPLQDLPLALCSGGAPVTSQCRLHLRPFKWPILTDPRAEKSRELLPPMAIPARS